MCHLAVDTTFGSRFGVKVCDIEMAYPRNVPTVVLMRRLKEKHPSYDFSFVVGSDLIDSLHEWDAPGARHMALNTQSEASALTRTAPATQVAPAIGIAYPTLA